MANNDLALQIEGNIILVHAVSPAGESFLAQFQNDDDHTFFGRALVVEHRYIEDFVCGAKHDGMNVE